MSDYSVWNQLFSLNPDTTPQTPMLSTQELQDELALWGNAQFQLEPEARTRSNTAADDSSSPTDDRQGSHQQQQQQGSWGFLDMTSQQRGHAPYSSALQSPAAATAQVNPLGFMMDSASTADLLNAITSPGTSHQAQHWAQIPGAQGRAAEHGAGMASLAHPQKQKQKQQGVSRAAAPQAQYRPAPIVPKSALLGDAAKSGDKPATPIMPAQSAAVERKTLEKAKVAAATGSSEVDDQDQDQNQQRHVAAAEDKRRRNTAASARFRVKKKLKEQALERTAQEMAAKAEALEKRVQELETETRWLKSLITEKDPAALATVRCPCHHPDGLEASPRASAGHHVSIAPNGAAGAREPPLKRARV
ncbi:hypothetical protein GGF46_003460 [Coemansia sp. RSA 552]|nr:hypothetical protein GGF46_003460 [Coemansia sp. RSA 552]